jgi:transcriptional regulator with XRE-family HTH domain
MSHPTETTFHPEAKPGAGSDVAQLRWRFGLSRERFSRLSGFSVRGLANWEAGVQKPGEQARLRLRELERLQQGLARVVGHEAIGEWMDDPNPAFDGLKPLEVIERGQVDRLWQMIFLVESGAAS